MRILFQGDSITDNFNRGDMYDMGAGYPKYASELLRGRFPEREFTFINRGINGDRTWDLLERWQTDCIDLQPDLLSILIGVNDTRQAFDGNNPTTAEQYEANYRCLLEDVRAHTKAKILMMEPYLLHDTPDKDRLRADLDAKIDAARRVARDFADAYIPLDGLFAAACVRHQPIYWSPDGIHPNENGAAFIGRYYADAAAELIK